MEGGRPTSDSPQIDDSALALPWLDCLFGFGYNRRHHGLRHPPSNRLFELASGLYFQMGRGRSQMVRYIFGYEPHLRVGIGGFRLNRCRSGYPLDDSRIACYVGNNNTPGALA